MKLYKINIHALLLLAHIQSSCVSSIDMADQASRCKEKNKSEQQDQIPFGLSHHDDNSEESSLPQLHDAFFAHIALSNLIKEQTHLREEMKKMTVSVNELFKTEREDKETTLVDIYKKLRCLDSKLKGIDVYLNQISQEQEHIIKTQKEQDVLLSRIFSKLVHISNMVDKKRNDNKQQKKKSSKESLIPQEQS
jgi:Na+/phosphate symporter